MNTVLKEGDLYKVINIFGKIFELRYGYYDENDRNSEFNEVIPIYPDFLKTPKYTDEGRPFVTQMQDVCEFFEGKSNSEECINCIHYHHGDDLLGICVCDLNQKLGGNTND